MLETVKGYKTVAFNVIVGLLLVWRAVRPADEIPSSEQVSTLLDSLYASLDAIMVVGNLVLRAMTNTAIGRKY